MSKFFKIGHGAVMLSKVEWFRPDADCNVWVGFAGGRQYFKCPDSVQVCNDLMTALTAVDTEGGADEDPWEVGPPAGYNIGDVVRVDSPEVAASLVGYEIVWREGPASCREDFDDRITTVLATKGLSLDIVSGVSVFRLNRWGNLDIYVCVTNLPSSAPVDFKVGQLVRMRKGDPYGFEGLLGAVKQVHDRNTIEVFFAGADSSGALCQPLHLDPAELRVGDVLLVDRWEVAECLRGCTVVWRRTPSRTRDDFDDYEHVVTDVNRSELLLRGTSWDPDGPSLGIKFAPDYAPPVRVCVVGVP